MATHQLIAAAFVAVFLSVGSPQPTFPAAHLPLTRILFSVGIAYAQAPIPSDPTALGAFVTLQGGPASLTCNGYAHFERNGASASLDIRVSNMLGYNGEALSMRIYNYMDLNSMASESNKIFGNSNEPASYDCRTTPTRAGVLSSIVAYSGEYSSYFTDLPLSFTGTDSIIGRAFAILNGTDECVDPQTPNPIRAKVMCFGVIGYPPEGLNTIGSSAANAMAEPVNATATVFNIIPKADNSGNDIIYGSFYFFQSNGKMNVYGSIASTVPLGGVRLVDTAERILNSTPGAFFYPLRHPKAFAGTLGSMTKTGVNGIFDVFEYTERGLSISAVGSASIIGYKVLLHSQPDDGCTQPDGNVGSGLATGYIGYDLPSPNREPSSNWAPPNSPVTCPSPAPGLFPVASQAKSTKTSFDVSLAAQGAGIRGCTAIGAKIQNNKGGSWQTVAETNLPATYSFTCLKAGSAYSLRFITKYNCEAGSPAGSGAVDSNPSPVQIFRTVSSDGSTLTFNVRDCLSWYSCFTYACGSTTASCDSTGTDYTVAPGSYASFMGATVDSSRFNGPRVNATLNSNGELCFDWYYTYGTPQSTTVTKNSKCVSVPSSPGKMDSLATAYDKIGDCYECTTVYNTYSSDIYFVSKGSLSEPTCSGSSLLESSGPASSASNFSVSSSVVYLSLILIAAIIL